MDAMSTIDGIAPTATAWGRAYSTFGRRIGVAAIATASLIERMFERRRSRLALLEMTDDQLKDIGVSRADAYREGIRPLWD